MENGNKLTEFKTVRRFLKNNVNGDVSKDAVIYIQGLLESYTKELCQELIIQHQEINRIREIHRLPKLKRYGVSTYLNGVGEGYKTPTYLMVMGEQAKSVKPPCFSDKADIEVV